MKVILDLEQLHSEGAISAEEYSKFSQLAKQTTGSLIFNMFVGFGVVAVSGALLALVPTSLTAIILGVMILVTGLALIVKKWSKWEILASICLLTGAIMSGGGLLWYFNGYWLAGLLVAVLYALVAIPSKSALLAVLATLTLSTCVGVASGYSHASYFIIVRESITTIILFSILGIGLYQVSIRLSSDYERLTLVAARTCVILVNFGFWVGSLWGKQLADVYVPSIVFSMLWAIGLIIIALWAWKQNRRWVLNVAAVFGAIHFYTQWFEHLSATPISVLLGGIVALAFAFVMKRLNRTR